MKKQSTLFRGIYEFEDDTGALLAAKVPFQGSADLYNGTAVNVRPNQRALFVYKGEVADVLKPGIHELSTGNVPILTRIASWKWGGQSPLRAEIWFFTGHKHIGKRFGTARPILAKFEGVGTIPIRAFGNYNVKLVSPMKFYLSMIGSKNCYDISELEEFIQGQLVELLPEALNSINDIQNLSKNQDQVSKELELLSKKVFQNYGFAVTDIQIKSLLPSKEIMEALESKVAMKLVGDPQKYLLYKAANGLEAMNSMENGDPTQMLIAMMLSRGVAGLEPPEIIPQITNNTKTKSGLFCVNCGSGVLPSHKFCSQCGVKQ